MHVPRLLAAAGGAALLAAAPAAADTTLSFDRAAGSPVRAVAPATAAGRTVTLPLTSATASRGAVRLRHGGGLRLGRARLRDVRAELADGGSSLSARVGGRRVRVFSVRGASLALGDDGSAELRRGALRVTRAGARALHLRAGRRVGTVAIEAPGRQAGPAPSPAARAVTGGQLDWGYNAALRQTFGGSFEPLLTGGAQVDPDGSFRLPLSDGSYDPATRRGTISSSGGFRIGYAIGRPEPTDAHGIWVTLRDVTVTLDGARGRIEATSDSGFHGTPPVPVAKRTIATLQVPEPVVSGDTLTWTALPATIAPGGAELVAAFQDRPGRPPLGDVRAIDPITITATLAP